jgi:hypothetical protein
MFKIKYLHRSSKSCEDHWENVKYFKIKNIDLFSDLPKRTSYKRGHNDIDFTPFFEFIETKIGEDWNDVYSEILKKTKKKFRYKLKYIIKYAVKLPIYDEDYIPRDKYYKILGDCIFIDIDNKLCKKSKDELISDAKRYKRKMKMQQLLENIKKEENENNNN